MNTDTGTRYGRVAAIYDALGTLYSAGAIRRARIGSAHFVEPESTVLCAGAGTGEEAMAAAQKGAHVTLLDSSQAMLARARRRFEREPDLLARTQFVEQTLEEHRPATPYDAVIASFFLNVFAEHALPDALARSCALVRPGGLLVVADFAAPHVSAWSMLQRAYYLPPLALFRVVTQNPWHPLYDYAHVMHQVAPDWGAPLRITVPALGLPLFEVLAWQSPVEEA